jgi:hypothetical protein
MTAHLVGGVVVETMSAVLTVPEENTAPELANRLFDAVQQVADQVVPVFGVVMQRRGDADHLVRAVSHGEPSPLAVVIGPEASEFLDRDGVWPPPRTTTATFGTRSGADGDRSEDGDTDSTDGGMIVRFEDGWEALESFLDRIDEDRFLQLVGGAPLDPAHDEGTLDGHVRDARVTGGHGAP